MGRFSPTVLPNYGPSLGEGLVQAADSFFAERDKRRQQKREDTQDQQRAEEHAARMGTMRSEQTMRAIQLQTMPGVSMEQHGVRDALNLAASMSPIGTPGGGEAPGVAAGQLDVNGKPMDVRYDASQSPAALSRAQQFKKIAEWQGVTNPATNRPFSQAEAYLLGTGSAKYADFKPLRPQRANMPRIVPGRDGYVAVDEGSNTKPLMVNGKPVMPLPRAAGGTGGETPEIAATRRDLAGTRTQQIRAETTVKNLKAEQRQLVNDHGKKIAGPLEKLTSAADSSAAQRYKGLPSQIDAAQTRLNRLTTRADSIGTALDGMRSHGPSAPNDPEPFDPQAFDESISDEELHDALANGAEDEEAVRSHVLARRGGQ